MGWLRDHLSSSRTSQPQQSTSGSSDLPPAWAPAEEASRAHGLRADATEDSYQAGRRWCAINKVEDAKPMASRDIERINEVGCAAWVLDVPRFERFVDVEYEEERKGERVIRIETREGCEDVSLLSNLPLVAGMYNIGRGKEGVYYEVEVEEMQGCIAVGAACRPYPPFRLPGWERLSAALHLDDASKFFEDPDGGRPYASSILLNPVPAGSIIGFGYEFTTASVFFTYNGERLENAFRGVFLPREKLDVYGCIGVSGPRNKLVVNFGGKPFVWKPGREWAWSLLPSFESGSIGPSVSATEEESLPEYRDVV